MSASTETTTGRVGRSTGVTELFLRPGVRLMSRLPMLWKIVAVSCVLLVPMLVLGKGYRSGIGAQTSFAAEERGGVEYAVPLMALIGDTVELRTANVRTALGQGGAQARAAAAVEAMDEASKKVDGLVQKGVGGTDLADKWSQSQPRLKHSPA